MTDKDTIEYLQATLSVKDDKIQALKERVAYWQLECEKRDRMIEPLVDAIDSLQCRVDSCLHYANMCNQSMAEQVADFHQLQTDAYKAKEDWNRD